jgi:hypothetical protein
MSVGRFLRTTLVLAAASLTVGGGIPVPATDGTVPPAAAATSAAATVIVPDLFRVNPARAYHRLRRLGLRVTIPDGFVVGQQGLADVQVTAQSPTPLSQVAAGRTVRLRVRCAPCAYLIDVAPPGPLRSAVVPDLIGRSISTAQYWVANHLETLVIHFGPLTRDTSPRLFGNYRIVHQDPAPGTRLALGVRTGTGDRIVPTPLEITAQQPG